MADQVDHEEAFNFKDYQEYINSEGFRQKQLNRLADNRRRAKSLEMENIAILSGFSDPEKKLRLINTVSQLWGVVLETDTELHTIDDIVKLTLESDGLQFFNENRNSQHFPSGVVFEEHIEHPTQKKLVRSKYLSKRQTKKQKTPMQTIGCVYSAKSVSDRDEKLVSIEKSLEKAHLMINALALNQIEIEGKLNSVVCDVSNIKEKVERIDKEYNDPRKTKLYVLYTSTENPSTKDLAELCSKDERTIRRWLKDFRERGLL